MPQLFISCGISALVGGALAGPVAASAITVLRVYRFVVGDLAPPIVDFIEIGAFIGVGTFLGAVVALLAGFPILVALALVNLRGVVISALVSAVLGALAFHFFAGAGFSIVQVSMGALLGLVCGAAGALYERRFNKSFHRIAFGAR